MGIINLRDARSLLDTILERRSSLCKYEYDWVDPETRFDEFRSLFIGDVIMELWYDLLAECEADDKEDSVRTLAEEVIVGLHKKGIPKNRFNHSGFETYVRLDCLKHKIEKHLFQTRVMPMVHTSDVHYSPSGYTNLNKDQMVDFMIEFDKIASIAKKAADDALFRIKIDNLRKGIIRANIEAIFNDILSPAGYRIDDLYFTGPEGHEEIIISIATAEGKFESIRCAPEEAEEQIKLFKTT